MFNPLNNRVLVKPNEIEEQSEGSIILAKNNVEKPVTGKVIVGNKDVKVGDIILFSKFGYDEVKIDGELHYVVSDFNILGIFNE